MSPTASALLLALFYFLGSCPGGSEAYLIKTWSAQDLALLGVSAYGSKCYLIPDNLTLCYGIGYDRMYLPNHLNHDTMTEAITQSQIWLALTRTNCHDDLRVFLCSMYAPVCLSEPTKLKPCRRLCENVRNGCLPRMRAVGYEWPDILRCDQFPTGSQLCVPPRASPKAECAPCRQAVTYENIISSYCMAPVVFKGRITRFVDQTNRVQISLHRKKKFYKSASLSRNAKRNLEMYLSKTNSCTCTPVTSAHPQDKWLIMGRLDNNQQLRVTFVIGWQRRNRAFKRAVRSIRRRRNICKFREQGRNNNKRKKKKKKRRNNGRPRRTRNGRTRNGRTRNGRRGRGRGGNGRRGNPQGMPQNPTPANATLLSRV